LISLSCGFAHQLPARKTALSVDASVEASEDKHDKPAAHAKNAEKAEKSEKVKKAAKAVTAENSSSTDEHVLSVHDSADAAHSHQKGHFKQLANTKTGGDDTGALLVAYGVAMIAMVAAVTAMFYPMGAAVCCQVVLYVSCLAFVKLALKIVYEYDFNYPKFITSVHLLCSSLAGFTVLAYRNLSAGKQIAVPTRDELFMGILPIASTFGFSIASENSALVFVSAAFSEVVASTNPVMSFTLTWVFGLGANLQLLMPIGVVILGCLISVEGEMYFSSMGLALLLLSVFFRGLKAVMQQKLMTGETKEKFDPVTLMAWTCLFAFTVVFLYSLATEGALPWNALAASPDLVGLIGAIAGSAVIAVTLNLSALFVIRQLGAVGMQMVSQMKALLVVIGGMALLGESFTNMQKIGFAIVLSGVYWYSRIQQRANAAAQAAAKGS